MLNVWANCERKNCNLNVHLITIYTSCNKAKKFWLLAKLTVVWLRISTLLNLLVLYKLTWETDHSIIKKIITICDIYVQNQHQPIKVLLPNYHHQHVLWYTLNILRQTFHWYIAFLLVIDDSLTYLLIMVDFMN